MNKRHEQKPGNWLLSIAPLSIKSSRDSGQIVSIEVKKNEEFIGAIAVQIQLFWLQSLTRRKPIGDWLLER